MTFIYALLFFLPALASYRTLEVGEAHAFRCIYGTANMEELVAIDRDPVCFWREREEVLTAPGATITHREFCQKFVQEAKEYVAQNCEDSKGKISFKDGEVIDEALQSVIRDDHPAWPTVRALFYGQACDRLSGSDRNKDFSGLEKEVRETVQFIGDIKDDFNDVHRWLSDPCAEYAIVDNLVMYRRGMYLSSAVVPEERRDFKTHYETFKKFVFTGWEGVVEHDGVAHAVSQYKRDQTLNTFDFSSEYCKEYCHPLDVLDSFSATEHFKLYCKPESLVRGNIITQSQQHLGWFYNIHELPSIKESYDPKVLETVLFPYSDNLTDSAFNSIVPFLTCNSHDWKSTPLTRDVLHAFGGLNQHAFLLKWRNEHCDAGWDIFATKYIYSPHYQGFPNTGWVSSVFDT